MIRKIISGLAFKVWSPSTYELEAKDDGLANGISQVAVHLADNQRWYISVLMKRGNMHQRGPFRSRDEAIGFIAARHQAVEQWGA